jgi:hypothetical protein
VWYFTTRTGNQSEIIDDGNIVSQQWYFYLFLLIVLVFFITVLIVYRLKRKTYKSKDKKDNVSDLLQQNRFDEALKKAKDIKDREKQKQALNVIDKKYKEIFDSQILPFFSSLDKIKRRMKEWKNQGYEVSELEQKIKSLMLEEKGFDTSEFKDFIDRAKKQEEYSKGDERYINMVLDSIKEKEK